MLEDYSSDYKTRLETLQLLSLMLVYELIDLSFSLKALQSPLQSLAILDHVWFSSSATHSNDTKLKYYSCHGNKHSDSYFNCLPQLWKTLFSLLILLSLAHKSSYSSKLLSNNVSYLILAPQAHVVLISNAPAAIVYFQPSHYSSIIIIIYPIYILLILFHAVSIEIYWHSVLSSLTLHLFPSCHLYRLVYCKAFQQINKCKKI